MDLASDLRDGGYLRMYSGNFKGLHHSHIGKYNLMCRVQTRGMSLERV